MRQFSKSLFLITIILLLFKIISCNNVEIKTETKFTVTYESEYAKAPESIEVKENTVLSAEYLPILEEQGYFFEGWFDGSTKVEADKYKVTKNVILYANWSANSNIEYKIEHYQQNIENDEYTIFETESKIGTTNENTLAIAKSYEGFFAKDFEQLSIQPDGTTVVKIFYDRKFVTLTFNTDGGTEIEPLSAKYGSTIQTPSLPLKTGYTFLDWEPKLPEIMPSEDMLFVANWIEGICIYVDEIETFDYSTIKEGDKLVIVGLAYESIIDTLVSKINSLNVKIGLDLSLLEGLSVIQDYAFTFCLNLTNIKISKYVTYIGKSAFSSCVNLEIIDIDESNLYYSSLDGVLFSKNINEIICYPAGKKDLKYVIPESVKFIDNLSINANIVIMKNGIIQQIGSPRFLYYNPINKYVAGFIGTPPMNFLTVKVLEKNGKIVCDEGSFEINPTDDQAKYLKDYIGKEVTFGIRPEDLKYVAKPAAKDDMQMKMIGKEFFGEETFLYLSSDIGQTIIIKTTYNANFCLGDTVNVVPDMTKAKFFTIDEDELNICDQINKEW